METIGVYTHVSLEYFDRETEEREEEELLMVFRWVYKI